MATNDVSLLRACREGDLSAAAQGAGDFAGAGRLADADENEEITKWCLDHMAERTPAPVGSSAYGDALEAAVSVGNKNAIEWTIARGADISWNVLLKAGEAGRVPITARIMELYYKRHQNYNCSTPNGEHTDCFNMVLRGACRAHQLPMAEWALKGMTGGFVPNWAKVLRSACLSNEMEMMDWCAAKMRFPAPHSNYHELLLEVCEKGLFSAIKWCVSQLRENYFVVDFGQAIQKAQLAGDQTDGDIVTWLRDEAALPPVK